MNNLQKDYSESEEVIMGWNQNDVCAVRMTHEQRWHRAKIQSAPNENIVQILAMDFGFQAIMFANIAFNFVIRRSGRSVLRFNRMVGIRLRFFYSMHFVKSRQE